MSRQRIIIQTLRSLAGTKFLSSWIYTLTCFSSLIPGLQAQNSYTFTSCGATGRVGPTSIQVASSYSSTNLDGLVGTTSPTSGIQTFTIPSGVNSVTIEAYGAQGGSVGNNEGGLGARIRGVFAVSAGQVLNIVVGQAGLPQSTVNCNGGGGAGASFVYLNSAPLPMIAAGGGGGGHLYLGPGLNGTTTTSASANASVSGVQGVNGAGGGAGSCGSGWPGAGGGGWSSAGGNTCLWNNVLTYGGASQYSFLGGLRNTTTNQGIQGQDGSFGGGGAAFHGAGGGGGYSGGGGGGSCYVIEKPLAGGGGSYNGGANQSNSAGINPGNGKVIITLSGLQAPLAVNIFQTGSVTCNGMQTGALTASASGGAPPYSYTWMPGSINGSVATNLTGGIYTVTASDATLATSSTTYNITQPPALILSLSKISANCNGNSNGSATVNVSGGIPPYTYTWLPTAGNNSVAGNLPVGNYTVNILDNNSCAKNATVSILQGQPINATASSNSICEGATVSLNGSGGTNYSWSGDVWNGLAFSPSVTSTYILNGTNTITGCSNTVAITVTVVSCVTGFSESLRDADLKIYPNPNSGEFLIETDNKENKIIELYNIRSEKLLSLLTSDQTISMNLNGFEPGIYFIRMISSGKTYYARIIRQ
jgi:hypothetical protein